MSLEIHGAHRGTKSNGLRFLKSGKVDGGYDSSTRPFTSVRFPRLILNAATHANRPGHFAVARVLDRSCRLFYIDGLILSDSYCCSWSIIFGVIVGITGWLTKESFPLSVHPYSNPSNPGGVMGNRYWLR